MKGLRDCQYEAVTELENEFPCRANRALMVLATGVGKTYTACLAAYRMLSYTPMRRVLFLVDRNNLGKQAEGEFGTFRLTENGEAFQYYLLRSIAFARLLFLLIAMSLFLQYNVYSHS